MKTFTHLGAYGVVSDGTGIVLVLKRRGPYTGSWDLPGGKIEFGETPRDALRRELWEEVGLTVAEAVLVDADSVRVSYTDSDGNAVELHHLGFIFHCPVVGTVTPRPGGDGQDVDETLWVAIETARALRLTPFAHHALRRAPNATGLTSGG